MTKLTPRLIKTCETCKYSRKITHEKCIMNLNRECAGKNELVRFGYNHWTPITPDYFLEDGLFEI